MTKRYSSTKKNKFIDSRPNSCLETSNIRTKCKFNFSYFISDQPAGQNFEVWNRAAGSSSLLSLMDKIKNFTNESLFYWSNQRVGAGGLTVYSCYTSFPKRSDFEHPSHIPHDVKWGRFRLGNKVRVIGFVIPDDFSDKEPVDENHKKYKYDCNTFYVVFLDKDHLFYKTEDD